MEGQGHMPSGPGLQKCDFCFATFQTLSELICHSCIHAPGNAPNRDLYQAQNFLTKANFNNPGFSNLDDLAARHNRLHAIDKQVYNNFYDSPFSTSSQLNFAQQIPAAHQNIPPAHQQIPTIHTPIFSSDKGYAPYNPREAAFAQQCSQGGQSDAGPSPSEHMSFNPELFQSQPFTATKIPTALTTQKKPIAKMDMNGEPKPPVPRKKRTGNDERNHKCYLCGSAFKKRSHLVDHLRIHTGERPFNCDLCGQTFIKKSDLARHNFTHTGQKPYKCDYCDAAYTTKSILRQHILIHTNEKPFKCTSCIAAFNRQTDLKQHMLIHTGEKPFKCDSCDSAFINKNQLKEHKALHTGEKLHKCILCGSSFKRRKGLKRHHRIHIGKKPHKCDVCEACFVERNQLKVHMRLHTGEKPFKCEQCPAAFRQKGLLKIHQKIHEGSKQYPCEQCTASFSRKRNLTIHKRVHSGIENFNQYLYQPTFTTTRIQLNMLNKSRKMEINEATAKLLEELTPRQRRPRGEGKYKCTECDAAFVRNSKLREHMSIHTGEKPYSCDLCESSFNRQSDMSRHRRIHTGDKPFKCKQCGASFLRKPNLVQHVKLTHSGMDHKSVSASSTVAKTGSATKTSTSSSKENTSKGGDANASRPFKCKYCSGIFMKKSHLEEHQFTHTSMKTYMCEKCDAAFTTKQKLKDHKLLHSSAGKKKKKKSKKHKANSDLEKPFKCKTCGEAFHKMSTLTRHNRSHGVTKAHKCEYCAKAFEERDQLKKHLKGHRNSKPFQCEKCEATFQQKGQMKFHLKSHEGNKKYKCDICSCSFSRKPSLLNHTAMHRQKAQEREYLDIKIEQEDVMDTAGQGSAMDESGEFDINRSNLLRSKQEAARKSSNKRKGFPKPHRPMKKKIKWIEGDGFIKAEIAETEDEDEDSIIDPMEISVEDDKIDKNVSGTEDDEADSEDELEEGEVVNNEVNDNDDVQSVEGEDADNNEEPEEEAADEEEGEDRDDIEEPELNTPMEPDQNGYNREGERTSKEEFYGNRRSEEQDFHESNTMTDVKDSIHIQNNERQMDRNRDVGGEGLERYGQGDYGNQLDNRHIGLQDRYRESNMDGQLQRSIDDHGDGRYGQLNPATGQMDYANQQKLLMSEGHHYQDYNSGSLGGNNSQHVSNMEPQKMPRSLWPSY